jgi:hypothetical protein
MLIKVLLQNSINVLILNISNIFSNAYPVLLPIIPISLTSNSKKDAII